jgi:nitrate reductase NapE component
MAQDFGESITPNYDESEPAEEKKDRKIWIIIAVVIVVLCCLCLVGAYGGWWLWNNGDDLFGLAAQLSQFVL